jgi:diguanylate cyclase (GGDEF)-like protein
MSRVAIICVDDNEIILSSLGNQLKRNFGKNYEIELATSGEEALTLCAELETEGIAIALVISDQLMPGMSGDKFLIRLHAIYPKTLKILLTGQAGADSVGNIVNAAALYRYIAKPWDETDLILTVKEAVRRYGQELQLAEQNIELKQANHVYQRANQQLSESNQKLAKSLKLLLAVFETAGDGIVVLDNQDEVIIFNHKFTSLWQLEADAIKGNKKHILGLISRRIAKPFILDSIGLESPFDSHQNNLLELINGKIIESYWQTQKLEGKIVGRVWGFRDVTAREQEKAAVNHRSQHDTLTELPKRRILTCQLSEAIARAEHNSHLLAVMFVDLNRFKKINSSLGHQIGDRLLQKVVARFKECIRGEDVIARWGNDEFTLMLPKIQVRDEATAIATRILEAFTFPFNLENKPVHVTIGIGIATYPEHGTDAETLLKNADAALSQAQQLSINNYQYYDSAFSSQAHQLLTLENQLHSALNKEEFILYYQPIVNVVTGKIAKMEALLRWQNPQIGLVSPYIFIPLAEENGSIVPIGEWVLKTACAQNKTWQNLGLEPIKMSINLSVRQFQQPNLVSNIAKILEQTQLQPNYLELEITESITMQDTDVAKAIFNELHNLGISLSMDDFGTGYSSLGYLKQFPFQTLKIDRSFVKDLHANSQDLAIVNAVITLGQGLNLNIVAEGVETAEIRDLLKNLGCEYIQGYLYSRPVPAAEATKLLQQHHS